MNKSFRLCNKDERAVFDKARREWHKEHTKAGLRLGILVVTGDGSATQALVTHHGATCAAKVYLTDWKVKLLAALDAVVIIDGDKFGRMKPERSIAVADHELTHLHVLDPAKDENDVARIEMIRDDWLLSGFVECVKRHGKNAIEARAIAKVGQIIFPFMDEQAVAPTLVPDEIDEVELSALDEIVEHCADVDPARLARARAEARNDDPSSDEDFIAKRDGDKETGKRGGGRKKNVAAATS